MAIPKIRQIVPTTEWKVVIRMINKTMVGAGGKRGAETEPLRVEKAPWMVHPSSSTPAVKAVEKQTVKPGRTRALHIDFKAEKREKFGVLLAAKKTKRVRRKFFCPTVLAE